MLYEFIELNRSEIIQRCRMKVAARSFPSPTEAEIDHGVPVFLDQLMEVLRLGSSSNPEISTTAGHHGRDLLARGFAVSQVVHDYGDVCQTITELALEAQAPISTGDFQTLNRCLDDAIAAAVTQFGHDRDLLKTQGVTPERGDERRLGFFIHELRNLVNTAVVSFEVLKTGNVGMTGSTASVLGRSLGGLRTLIANSLAELRLTEGILNPTPIHVAEFIDEVGAAAALEAGFRGVRFSVRPVAAGLVVHADRQVLALVLGNLLQNAFKFTRPQTTVHLRIEATADRVHIEIEDECGGFAEGNAAGLFRPFEQRSADRSGLGLGLAFSRWGVEASQGTIGTRNLPGHGCIFIVDLPRVATPAAVIG
jgi:signal transduction histidine kinase